MISFLAGAWVCLLACVVACGAEATTQSFERFVLDYTTPSDLPLREEIERIDKELRTKYAMTGEQTAVGLLDLAHPRVAMIHPDRIEYAATVRQLLRHFPLLEQRKLVSPEASKTMREIFASPDIPHDDIKFVKALADRPGVQIIRKWGTWEDWHHDCAVVTAPGRHYILVALTKHPKGDEYLVDLAQRMDDVMQEAK